MKNTSRYFIHKERIGKRAFYSMYAPLLGEDGSVQAIICSPYTDESYDFESYVVSHSLMIVSLFIFLLLVATFMVSRVLALMFKPLVEMGTKMDSAGSGELEYIQYNSKDEISGLVNAYNNMVTELRESTRQLAQAERDKAWSGMARQVAHEIKNPLTPMKLQIQRLMRLKSKGDESWQDKFDESSKTLLDHIDMLTETANEFSTFAKLYSQEPDEINLSALLQEELSMFDNRDGFKFEYIGLEDVMVMGPKPQLTRAWRCRRHGARESPQFHHRRLLRHCVRGQRPGCGRREYRQVVHSELHHQKRRQRPGPRHIAQRARALQGNDLLQPVFLPGRSLLHYSLPEGINIEIFVIFVV